MSANNQILVIDDELNVVNMLQINLEAEGYDVATAYNGREGLDRIRSVRPDLVICDVMMPEMDGFELCRLIREDDATASIPFIFLTAKSDMPEKIDGFNAGADDYMTKPFNLDELIARVNAILVRVERIRADNQDVFHTTSQDLNRLSSLGILAASIAHEVRNQLTTLVNSAEMMRFTKNESRRDQYSDTVVSQVDRINQTICAMLNFAKRQETVYEPQQPGLIVEDALDLTRPRVLSQDVTVDTQIPDDLPLVSADRQQICQVLINLIINATQAVEKGGRVEVRVVEVDHHIEIQVSDNGCGMPKDIQDTIFEPFISTKGQSGGIGLGLYISKEIVEAHKGVILVESTEGQGTCFTIRLPTAASRVSSDTVREGRPAPADLASAE